MVNLKMWILISQNWNLLWALQLLGKAGGTRILSFYNWSEDLPGNYFGVGCVETQEPDITFREGLIIFSSSLFIGNKYLQYMNLTNPYITVSDYHG